MWADSGSGGAQMGNPWPEAQGGPMYRKWKGPTQLHTSQKARTRHWFCWGRLRVTSRGQPRPEDLTTLRGPAGAGLASSLWVRRDPSV